MSLRSRGRDVGADARRDGDDVVVQRDARSTRWRARPCGDGAWILERDGAQQVVHAIGSREGTWVQADGRAYLVERAAHARTGAAVGSGHVMAPMTGTVLGVRAREGERVEADQVLLVLSAMKMQVEITAGVAGILKELRAVEGQQVEGGSLLVVVEPPR